MATKNLVPRANGEGQIGTSAKKWSQANFQTGSFDNLNVGSSTINETIDDRVDALLTAGSNITLTYNNAGNSLTIAAAGGSTTLAGLSDTTISSPSSGHILVYDGSDSFDNKPLSGDATLAADGALTLSSSASPTFASLTLTANAGLNMSDKKITNLATPTSNNDAANKSYVDSVAQGLDVQPSVRLLLTSISNWSGNYANGSTHQGVTLSTGDRILSDSSLGSQSGIFVVQASGAPTRPSNFDTDHEAAGTFVFVEEGTYADKGYVCTNDRGSDVVDTDWLVFTQFTQINLTAASLGGININSTNIKIDVNNLGTVGNESTYSALEQLDTFAFYDNSVSDTKKIKWMYLKGQILQNPGHDINLNTHKIHTNDTNGSIKLEPNGTGSVLIRGNKDNSGTNPGSIKLNCEENTHGITIKSPLHSAAANYTLTLPVNDGDANQVLKTDGSGVLSWVDQASGGGGGLTYDASVNNGSFTAAVNKHYSVNVVNTPVIANLPTTGTGQISFKNMNSSNSLTVRVAQGLTPAKKFDGTDNGSIVLSHKEAVTVITDGSGNWEIR